MRYRLDELVKLASELGLKTRRVDADRLDVHLRDAVLAFCNLSEDEDTLVGFDGTPWHAHNVVVFMTGDSSYIECNELDILIGLGTGELVIVSQYVDGILRDRWLAHRGEPLDLRYIEPDEELRVWRLPDKVTPE